MPEKSIMVDMPNILNPLLHLDSEICIWILSAVYLFDCEYL